MEEERHDFGDDDDYDNNADDDEYDDDRHDKTARLKSGRSSLSVSEIRVQDMTVPYDTGDVVARRMRLTITTNAESERIGGKGGSTCMGDLHRCHCRRRLYFHRRFSHPPGG